MSEQIFVVGGGPSALASAVKLARTRPSSSILVFAGTTPDGGAEDAGLPLFLHDQGRAALSALGVIEPAFPLLTVDRGSGPVPSAEVYGQAAEVLTRGSLMDGLLAEANMLPNLAIRSDVTVSGIDAAKGQLFVDGEDQMFQSYDLPRLLVLADSCFKLVAQLTAVCPGAAFEPAPGAAIAALVATGLADSEAQALTVCSKGSSAVAVFPELRVAVVTTPVSNAAMLSDSIAVRSLLKEAGAPAACIAPLAAAAGSRRSITLQPGCAGCVGFRTAKGVDIVLVGPAAVQTHAPLCLDVNLGLHSAVQMVAEVTRGGAAQWNAAFQKVAADLVARSKPADSDVAMAAFGLSGRGVAALCTVTVASPNRIQGVVMAPVRLAKAAIVNPIGGLLNRFRGQ